MTATEAAAELEAYLGQPLSATPLYRTQVNMPSGAQRVHLLGFSLNGTFHVGLVGAQSAPWAVAVPDWGTTRKGRRERERDLIRLYVGRALYQRRKPLEPTDKMRALADRRLQVVARSPQVAHARVTEVVRIPGHGGTHVTFHVTRSSGREEFRNQRGRAHSPARTVLQAIAEHPTWFFLGLEFGA